MQIRSAVPADAPAIADLARQLGYDPAGTDARLADVLGRDGHAVLVADDGAAVVGWVHVHETREIELPPYASIAGLVVAAARRRDGVGSRLLEAAEEWGRSRGMAALRLRSNQVRDGAHAFYLARGYEVEKTQVAFLKRF